MLYRKKTFKGTVLSGILIKLFLFILLFIIVNGGESIQRYNTGTEGLKYTYDLVKSEELIGMDYYECRNLLKDAEDNYEDFYFMYEYKIDEKTYCRTYSAGEQSGFSGPEPYILRVYFGSGKVVDVKFHEAPT